MCRLAQTIGNYLDQRAKLKRRISPSVHKAAKQALAFIEGYTATWGRISRKLAPTPGYEARTLPLAQMEELAMPTSEMQGEGNVLAQLLSQNERLIEKLSQPKEKPKDRWDKFATLSTFFSSVVLASAALIVTQWVNSRNNEAERKNKADQAKLDDENKKMQGKLYEMDVLVKFMPYLTKGANEADKRQAVLYLKELGTDHLARLVATTDPSPGKTIAIAAIAAQTKSEEDRAFGSPLTNRASHGSRDASARLAACGSQTPGLLAGRQDGA